MVCPECGGSDQLGLVVFPHRTFSWSVFILGGIVPVLFLNSSRPNRYHCFHCGKSFSRRSPGAWLALVLLVAWLAFCWLPFLIWVAYILSSRK
jgi:hypothetical protein